MATSKNLIDSPLEEFSSAKQLAASLKEAALSWDKELRNVYYRNEGNSRDWLEFEGQLWQVGERIRQLLTVRKPWAKSVDLHKAFATVVGKPSLGFGRQPYFELLAKHGGVQYSTKFFDAIDDPEVAGQAIRALRIARIDSAQSCVQRTLQETGSTLVRRECKAYLKWLEKHRAK